MNRYVLSPLLGLMLNAAVQAANTATEEQSGQSAAAQNPVQQPGTEKPRAAVAPAPAADSFTPSDKISADSAVSFPVDI